jgi:hypothetical protein
MRPIEIEIWALRVIDQVREKAHAEDSRVELKSEWPDPENAARRLAAHCNAAHGEPVLWLIGVDEQSGVCGAEPRELADWFSAVRARFDYVYPAMRDLNVSVEDRVVVALLFESDRAPYLVKNPVFGSPKGGPVQWEVPWREGRKTTTASREQLVRMLSPQLRAPEVEFLTGRVQILPNDPHPRWFVSGELYIVPLDARQIVLPFHRCGFVLSFDNSPAASQCATACS